MRKFYFFIILAIVALNTNGVLAQDSKSIQHPTLISTSEEMVEIMSIADQIANGTFIASENFVKEFNPKKWGKNNSVPGKGLPNGDDPLWQQQKSVVMTKGKAPSLTFEAASSGSTPTDPTGAVGPNHFVNSWNSSFRIWDKAGNPLTAAASLATILPGSMGDPIVIYDRYADRFLITEFYSNGFYVGISQGPDPVNDGWYVYTFPTNTFPDYPKFSVWSDGYYITANKDQSSAATSEVVFVIERDKIINGDPSAQMVGFPLTSVVTSGFYSPLGFNANGSTLPPVGDAPIVYMQDDAWSGVSSDHIKLWNINVNWSSPASSTISSPQIISTTPFDGLFDGGSFSNLPQPSGGDIDALQATIMYMAQYRRFAGYNTVVFNFVVDLNGADNYSGIRWYELRQTNDGDPWTIYQEGTYSQPGGHSAFSGNMCMDASGNIALAYTTVSSSLYPSLRYTGRNAGDPPGTMTFAEEVIGNGTQSDPSTRYGDYSQMTIDPADDATFWSIGEYFTGGTRKNQVGVFQFAPPVLTAEFVANPTQVCNGSSTTFSDQSLGSPTSWNWIFTGGTPSSYTGQNPPAITYSSPGTYNVSLTVGDGIDTDTQTKTGYITVNNVLAGFTVSSNTVIVGGAVTFTDNSSCAPTSWNWSFPGGTPSSFSGQTPPAITYNATGNYDVSLTVTNASGSDTNTEINFINVINCVYCASAGSTFDEEWISNVSFNSINNTTASPAGYNDYTNISTDVVPGTAYTASVSCSSTGSWTENYFIFVDWNQDCDFDDAGESYDLGQTTGPGTRTLSITVPAGAVSGTSRMRVSLKYSSNPTACETISYGEVEDYSLNIIGAGVAPVADFNADVINPAIGQTVVFTDLSVNTPTSWSWSFNPTTITYVNSTNATSQNPEVQFDAPGLYTVTLTAANAFGSDGETKTNYINAVGLAPVAEFFADNTTPFIGGLVNFTDLSSNIPTSWTWTFDPATVTYLGGTNANSQNPQVQFDGLGLYTVTLSSTNSYGTDDEIKADYINVLDPGACTPCVSSYSNTADDWISRVTINTLDNPSGSVGYEDFTGLSTSLISGDSYSIVVEINVTGSWLQYANVWVDWNGNCDFSDAGELTDLGVTPGTTGIFTLSGLITVPVNAVDGVVQMRVAERYSSSPGPCDQATWGETEDYSINVLHKVNLNLTAMLEGPFNGAAMNNDINTILPLTQPFSGTPWFYTGTESVAAIPGPDVIEWVLVDLRDANSAGGAIVATRIERQAAFITATGQVVDINGNSVIPFNVAVTKNLYVALYQRNHLAVLSGNAVIGSSGNYVYDFSAGESQAYGGLTAHKLLTTGIWGLIAGDGNKDGTVSSLDESPLWESQSGSHGILESDYNLDGESNNIDKDDYWQPNIGSGTQVPN